MNGNFNGTVIGKVGVHVVQEGQGHRVDRCSRQREIICEAGIYDEFKAQVGLIRETEWDRKQDVTVEDASDHRASVRSREPQKEAAVR